MGKKSVADLLVDTLVSRRVSRVYGVAGDSLSGRGDEIIDLARTNLWR
jgi:thiamine pyrophosphate-dependent acetolactate synthase large subunit-like protein